MMKALFKKTTLALALASLTTAHTFAASTESQAATAGPVAVAEAELDQQEMDAVAANLAKAAEPEYQDPGVDLQEMIADFEDSPLGQSFLDKPGVFYTVGEAWVMGTPESRDWGNARVMAYKEALLKAQAKYISYLGISIKAESMRRFFKDPTQMPSFEPEELRETGKIAELLDKAVALAGGKLDQQLMELGIDPEEFAAAPREKRAVLFNRATSETVKTRARQSLTGVIPLKTFESYDQQGNHAVAVAIVASNNFRQFIYDVIHSKGDLAPKPEKAAPESLRAFLRKDKKALLSDFGIRRMYDQNGYPVLVSFGQSSNPYRGDDPQARADEREMSFTLARNSAYANFAYLFNSTGIAEESASTKMERKRVGIARAEGTDITESEEETQRFISTVDSEITARGSVSNLPGTKELFRWTAKHPMHGHEINGVVYIWHPLAEQNARQLRDFKPAKSSSQATRSEPKRPTQEAGRMLGRDLMSADDF